MSEAALAVFVGSTVQINTRGWLWEGEVLSVGNGLLLLRSYSGKHVALDAEAIEAVLYDESEASKATEGL